MGISEILLIMLVYGGLFLFAFPSISSNNKILVYIKSIFLIVLYLFISAIIWFSYKGKEYHLNNHSGFEPISFTGEVILVLICFSIFNIILLLLGIQLKSKMHYINP